MRKAGRYTAALLLICVGAAVMADQYMGTQWTSLLIEWWPVLFVALGIEYILFNMKYGESEKQLKLDVTGVIFAVIISAVVIGSTQSTATIRNWFGNLDFGDAMLAITDGEGRKFDQGTTDIPLDGGIDRIQVINPYGSVVMNPGSSDKLQIQSIIYVAVQDEQKASEIASQSKIEHSVQGNKLTIKAEGKEYGQSFWDRRKVRTDMIISIPAQASVSMDLESTNGKITAEKLKFKEELQIITTNGQIQLTSVQAPRLNLESTNARIITSETAGKMRLESTNGGMEVTKHQGDVEITSTNGSLALSNVSGAMQVETTNGSIQIKEAPSGLKANTTNGSVEVTSRTVNGEWDIETNHGSINLSLPSNGDYSVHGEGEKGAIRTSLPLQIDKDSIKGNIGSGKHKIELNTNGSISIQKAD